jgi:hypothetical protein
VVRPRHAPGEALAAIANQCTRCDADPASPSCSVDGVAKDKMTLLFEHCFPGGMRYAVRASQQWVMASSRALHDVTARLLAGSADPPLYECVRDCDPRRRLLRSRAFEISSSVDCADAGCGVGMAREEEVACAYDPTRRSPGEGAVKLDEPAAACIFENLVARFAVYRGTIPSVRGMTFTWSTSGGFSTMVAALTAHSTQVLPQRIGYLPELQSLAVVDAASLGLSLISLDTLRVNTDWPVY